MKPGKGEDGAEVIPLRREEEPPPAPRERGIYLLPNLFTTGALFAGFCAVIGTVDGRYELAAILIYVAMLLDGLDGRIARLTNTQSAFGAEYDSLSDVICFGLAPALLAWEWRLADLGRGGVLIAFVYVAAAALRLARFNSQTGGHHDRRWFQGLPSPAAAALVVGAVWFGERWGLREPLVGLLLVLVAAVCAALLMVSNVRYASFKDVDARRRLSFVNVLGILFAFALVAVEPSTLLPLAALAYATSGPVLTIAGLERHRAGRRPG